MLRKDYIMRQFEEFGIVIGAILGLKRNKEWEKFELEIDKAVKLFTSLELTELKELQLSEFEKLIHASSQLKPDQIKALADLLYEQSFAEQEKNNTKQAVDLLEKSLLLYTIYKNELTSNQFNLETHYRIELITKILNLPNPQ
ncbi:MAG: hypothetical protein JNM96_03425 [Bacteroidia bacterium]|nr:hypothetical protein [Bacteroidia bacterium]